jgi:hypothetical protein
MFRDFSMVVICFTRKHIPLMRQFELPVWAVVTQTSMETLTMGIATGADGLPLRRWPNVGVVGVEGLQATQPTKPSVYESPRLSPGYANGHPRRLQVVGVCRGHVSLQVQGGPVLLRCYAYADSHPRRLKAVGVWEGYAEGCRRCIPSENLKLLSSFIFVFIYLLLSII